MELAMQVHVYLPSGKSCSVSLPPESSIRELKAAAQQQLKCRFLALAFRGQQLDVSSALGEVGVRDGEHIDAIMQSVRFASTASSFALYVPGGTALTWGNPGHGGDSSEVREKLVRVQQIQGTSSAFAAIMENGSVVTWGNPAFGGDSSEVREQLVQVQQIRATSSAFAAILADGSLVTWGNPHFSGDSSKVQTYLDFL
ncbi:unnamed protein product [Effrenium voratum]|nr:unnamed protein product [Effrenium voratum]